MKQLVTVVVDALIREGYTVSTPQFYHDGCCDFETTDKDGKKFGVTLDPDAAVEPVYGKE